MLFASRDIILFGQLRPVTYRGICDLTLLELNSYSKNPNLFRRVVILPTPADPIPGLADVEMNSGPVLRELWNTCSCRGENFPRKGFFRIVRISMIPSCLSKYPSRYQAKCEYCSQKHDQQPRRE